MLSIQGTVLVFVNGPFDVMRDKKVQLAVIVIIEPYGAGGEAGISYTRFCRNIGKLAIAEIVEEMIAANGGDIDIVIAIIVVVPHRAAQAVHLNGQAGSLRHISKSSILIIMVEGRSGPAGFVSRPIHGINQQDVLPAVIVIINKADAGAHGFRKIFLAESAVVVFEMYPGLCGDIDEYDGACRTEACCHRQGHGLRFCETFRRAVRWLYAG